MQQKFQPILNPFQDLYDKFRNDLQIVDNLIFGNISSTEPLIEKISEELVFSGGKRLRPLLCIVSAHISGEITKNSHFLAAAIELIHAATLLHDDVIDESNLRRGKKTANVLWGNKASILVGDFLFSRTFELMVKTGNIHFLEILASSSSKISEGEIMQLRCLKNLNLNINDYLKIIEYKTATLFATACFVGALSGNPTKDTAYKLYEFGKNFGLMYQILDDVLDYTDENRGKELGDDFREGKVTFPILLGYQKDPDKLFWHRCFDKNKRGSVSFDHIRSRLNNLGAFNQSIAIAQQYAQKAKNALDFSHHSITELLEFWLEDFFN